MRIDGIVLNVRFNQHDWTSKES